MAEIMITRHDIGYIFPIGDHKSHPKGGDMSIKEDGVDRKTGLKRYKIDEPWYDPAAGKSTHIKRTAIGSEDLARKIAEITALKGGAIGAKTFCGCTEHYQAGRGFGSKKDVFERNCREIGAAKIDRQFPLVYTRYINKIRVGRKINTVNNYRICIRSVLNYCFQTNFIEEQPVRDFGLEAQEARDRLWTEDERQRILNILQQLDSYLLPVILFAERNPIRKADLFNLKRDDVDMSAAVVRFVADKTDKISTLPNVDNSLIRHIMALPADCPWLFPAYGTAQNRQWSKLQPGEWRKIKDADKHWNRVLRDAKVIDLHFHDLKAVAETYMIHEQGYAYADLQKLGIQCSPKTQRIYDRRGAMDIIERRRELVIPQRLKVVNG